MFSTLRAEIVNLDKTNVVQRGFSENVAISPQRAPDTLTAVFHSQHKKSYEHSGSSNNRLCINLSWKDKLACSK